MGICIMNQDEFIQLDETTYEKENKMERGDIQRLLKKQIDIIDPNLYVLCEEFSSWEDSDRRIDLLCLDDQGNLVVIELKRTLKDAHADLQAIRYAAMVSKMTYENVVSLHLDYLKKQFPQEEFSAEKAECLINEFIASKNEEHLLSKEDFASDVKIILIAPDFSRELTTTALWLRERDIEIKCVRIKPYKYKNDILVDVQQIIPPPETNDYLVKIKAKETEEREVRRGGSPNDYTRFEFYGEEFNKGEFVYNVVNKYLLEHPETTYAELLKVFPDEIQGSYGVLRREDEIQPKDLKNPKRYDPVRAVVTKDGVKSLVCTQWGAGGADNKQAIQGSSMYKFITRVRELGYEFSPVGNFPLANFLREEKS